MNAVLKYEWDRQKAHDAIDKLKLDGPRSYDFKLTLSRKKRTLPQNRMWHAWMKCMEAEAEMGSYSKRWWEVHYKYMFLEEQLEHVMVYGQKRPMEPHTRDLSTAEFTEFLNKVKTDAWETHDVNLPVPEDLGWDDLVSRYDRTH